MTPPAPPLIRLRNVRKSFITPDHQVHQVLKDIHFDVHRGEVVTLIGPSGSGKSTCLRAIAALETIDGGEIALNGQSYASTKCVAQVRQQATMVFQRFELFPHLTALQNVALGPRIVLKKTKQQAEERAADLLTKVGLSEHVHKFPGRLSGGQQQRVAIARALALDPQVLLCDEPTSALDPELVHGVLDLLRTIAKTGMTMIVVTHEMGFAEKVSTRTLFLDQGEIVEQGSAHHIFHNPQGERLKQFLSRVRH